MLKTAEFSSSAHPTTSSSTAYYSPLIIDGSFETKRSCRDYRLIRHDETEEEKENTAMVDTVTAPPTFPILRMVKTVEFPEIVPRNFQYFVETDDSLCGDDHQNAESRSNSTMGGGGNMTGKRKGFRNTGRNVEEDGRDGVGGGGAEWMKALFLFVFLLIAGISNWAVIAYTHDFVPREPLPDIVFSLVPEQRWASSLGDVCVALCIVILAALLIVHQHRGTILKRVVFCAATLYAMRSITLAVTQLPSAYTDNSGRCRERVAPQFAVFMSRLIEQTIRIGFQSKDQMLCGDLLFSGHTLVMVTCSLAVAYYLPRSIKPLQWLAHISCAVGMVCMIVSRTHYTIDVVIAYWLGNMVFRIYHAYCEVDMCMERQKSILYSWWPCRIIDWLEENIVPGRLENRCQWPCGPNSTWGRRRRGDGASGAGGGGSSSESSTCEPTAINPSQQHHKQVSISSSSTYQLPC